MTKSVCSTNSYGTKRWILNGVLHREDGPAFVDLEGVKQWFVNGKHHREDGPAFVDSYGNKEWCLNGRYFSSKEEYFDHSTEENKEKLLYNPEFMNGPNEEIYLKIDIFGGSKQNVDAEESVANMV